MPEVIVRYSATCPTIIVQHISKQGPEKIAAVMNEVGGYGKTVNPTSVRIFPHAYEQYASCKYRLTIEVKLNQLVVQPDQRLSILKQLAKRIKESLQYYVAYPPHLWTVWVHASDGASD